MTSGFLNAGPGLLLEAHRDTWYADPFSQINWWMPIFDYTTESGMAFYPHYFTKGIENDSQFYDLQEWRTNGMAQAAKRKERVPGDNSMARKKLESSSDLRIVMPPGAIMLFSAAHLHATTPNTSGRTRFSLDFRTVNMQDVLTGTSADNVDTAARGTTLGDFSRLSDGSKLHTEATED
ncbi:phytanoyl-CoA dioxygenase family protein [Streptomyces collinus]|uniref:phytanoyl-CoA dioxygenase family protein n=1 Tax=Streptomyces collinus TaxID=42684 RepID=UPI0036AF18E3